MTAIERAFQLAQSGRAASVTEIIVSLKREGYSIDQIQGPSLRRQLAGLIRSARPDKSAVEQTKSMSAREGDPSNVSNDRWPKDR